MRRPTPNDPGWDPLLYRLWHPVTTEAGRQEVIDEMLRRVDGPIDWVSEAIREREKIPIPIGMYRGFIPARERWATDYQS